MYTLPDELGLPDDIGKSISPRDVLEVKKTVSADQLITDKVPP